MTSVILTKTVISVQVNVWPQNLDVICKKVTKFERPVDFNRDVIDRKHESGGICPSLLPPCPSLVLTGLIKRITSYFGQCIRFSYCLRNGKQALGNSIPDLVQQQRSFFNRVSAKLNLCSCSVSRLIT